MMKLNRDFMLEPSAGSHYNYRIITGKFASVVFNFINVRIKKRWFRAADMTFTYNIHTDEFGDVAKDRAGFEVTAKKILKGYFTSLQED